MEKKFNWSKLIKQMNKVILREVVASHPTASFEMLVNQMLVLNCEIHSIPTGKLYWASSPFG